MSEMQDRNLEPEKTQVLMDLSSDQVFQLVTKKVFEELPLSRIEDLSYPRNLKLKALEIKKEKIKQEYAQEIDNRKRIEKEAKEIQLKYIQNREIYQLQIMNSKNQNEREQRKRLEAQRRQLAISEKFERSRIDFELKRQEDEEKRKREQVEKLYQEYKLNNWLYSPPKSIYSPNPNVRIQRPWNFQNEKKDDLMEQYHYRLGLEEIYHLAPLSSLTDAYRKLELELLKIKDIIEKRYTEREYYEY